MSAKSDYGRDVADTVRQVKRDFAAREGVPVPPNANGSQNEDRPIDPSVRETVNAELDKVIERHEAIKPYPGTL